MLRFVACMVGSLTCQTITQPAPGMLACMVQGELQAELWLAEHPKYRLVGGWSCTIGGRPEKDA